MTKTAKSTELRRRPETVRYFYLAVTPVNLHTGLSWHGLNYVRKNYEVIQLYLADLCTGYITLVTEDIDVFMEMWSINYSDPTWEYISGGELNGESINIQD